MTAERIVSVQHVGNTLVVIRRIESNVLLMSMPPQRVPDKLVKEVWGVRDGQLVLLRTVPGCVAPPSPETFMFDEEDGVH